MQEQPAPDDESEGVGDTKLRGPADATTEAFGSGEAADNIAVRSLPDTEMEGGSDPLPVACRSRKASDYEGAGQAYPS